MTEVNLSKLNLMIFKKNSSIYDMIAHSKQPQKSSIKRQFYKAFLSFVLNKIKTYKIYLKDESNH